MLTREIGEIRFDGIGCSNCFSSPDQIAGIWDSVLEFGRQVGRDALASARQRLGAYTGAGYGVPQPNSVPRVGTPPLLTGTRTTGGPLPAPANTGSSGGLLPLIALGALAVVL